MLALEGADTQLGVAAAADRGAGPPLAFEGTGGYWLLPIGRPSARSGRSSQIIAELEGGSTLASACRAARSSPPRGLEDASKPRFDR